MNKKAKKRLGIGLGLTTLLVVCIICAVTFWPKPVPNTTIPVVITDDNLVTCMDPNRNEAIEDEGDVNCDEYRLPVAGNPDPTDWSEWVQNTDVTDLEDVEVSDFTSAYSRIVLVYSVNSTDMTDLDGVQYYERQAEIFKDRVNTLYFYETPMMGGVAAAGFTMINSDNLTVFDYAAKNVSANLNFTITASINQSQPYAEWASYWDFSTNDYCRLNYVFTFNATCASSDIISKSGLVKTRPSTITLAFAFDNLDVHGATHKFVWGASPSDVVIDCDSFGAGNGPIVLQYKATTI